MCQGVNNQIIRNWPQQQSHDNPTKNRHVVKALACGWRPLPLGVQLCFSLQPLAVWPPEGRSHGSRVGLLPLTRETWTEILALGLESQLGSDMESQSGEGSCLVSVPLPLKQIKGEKKKKISTDIPQRKTYRWTMGAWKDVTKHQGNANENHIEIIPHTSCSGCDQKDRKDNCWWACGERKALHTIVGNVN